MRTPEWLFVGFFAYITLLSVIFPSRPNLHSQPVVFLVGSTGLFMFLSRIQRGRLTEAVAIVRDWLPIVFTFLAFREMELFVPAKYPLIFESAWIKLDQLILHDWGLRALIEGTGKVLPLYFEFCYLLVYGLAVYSIGWIAASSIGKRIDHRVVDRFWTIYLTGTLTAYALFPYFPSLPPRYAFQLVEPPTVVTWVRTFNLWLLEGATIHSGVFPSAHVSSAFSSAWALYLIFPKRRWLGHIMLIYAVSVSIATVYGRYHYVADVLAGFGVSLVALGVGFAMRNYVQKHQSA